LNRESVTLRGLYFTMIAFNSSGNGAYTKAFL